MNKIKLKTLNNTNKRFKKRLNAANARTLTYLASLPSIYLIGQWAHYGMMEFSFAGWTEKPNGQLMPLVYDYYDANGLTSEYVLCEITRTTTGKIITWTFDKADAERIVNELELHDTYTNTNVATLNLNIKDKNTYSFSYNCMICGRTSNSSFICEDCKKGIKFINEHGAELSQRLKEIENLLQETTKKSDNNKIKY